MRTRKVKRETQNDSHQISKREAHLELCCETPDAHFVTGVHTRDRPLSAGLTLMGYPSERGLLHVSGIAFARHAPVAVWIAGPIAYF